MIRAIVKLVGTVFGILLLVGLVSGVLKWNKEQGGEGLADLLVAIVSGIAGVIPSIINWVIETGSRLF